MQHVPWECRVTNVEQLRPHDASVELTEDIAEEAKGLERKASLERLQQRRARLRSSTTETFRWLRGKKMWPKHITYVMMNVTTMMKLVLAPVNLLKKFIAIGLAFGNGSMTLRHAPCRNTCSKIRCNQSHNGNRNRSPPLCFISVPSNRKVRLEALMDGVAVKSAFGRSTCGSPLPLLLEDPKRICQNKGGSVNGTVLLRCQNWLRWRICIGAWCQSHPAQEWYQGQLATQQHGSRRKRDVIRSLDSLASLAEALASLDLSQAFDRIRPCLVLWHA